MATGLGALPFAFVRSFSRRWLGAFNAIAGGLMLGATHGLINEGVLLNLGLTLLGLLVGLAAIALLNDRLEHNKSATITAIRKTGRSKALMIVGIMTLHSFAEGVGVGVAFGGGQALGTFITAAIAIHNIPEGLAISLVLVPRGSSPFKAALWSIFSSLPQPLMAVPAFILVSIFRPFLPFGLGVAAGAMLWMVFSELIPDSIDDLDHQTVGVVVTLSLVAMIAFQTLL